VANHHFGELGDIWKHLSLAELLALEHPVRYWESHAGSATYPLARTWQREYGIYYFLDHAQLSTALAASRYYALLSSLPSADGYPRVYPGSPLLAMLQLSSECREYLLCDLDSDSIASLNDAACSLDLASRAECVLGDGIATLWERAATLSTEDARRTFVHIDPFEPFEASGRSHLSAIALCCKLAERGFQVVYWYGYDTLEERGWAWRLLSPRLSGATTSLWCGDLSLVSLHDPALPPDPGVRGCGVLCANLAPDALDACSGLGAAMESIYRGAVFPDGQVGALAFHHWPDIARHAV
jgi:23S rRNA A2030 N6-methylase RlmJ